jgi:hypothetical protein
MVPASKQSLESAASNSASASNHDIPLSGIDALANEAEQEALLKRSMQSLKRKHGDDDEEEDEEEDGGDRPRPQKQLITRDADEIDI